jgi:hypothetical protein
MNDDTDSKSGLIRVLMQRFETEHLDRILMLKESVDDGKTLSNYEQTFLENVCQEALKSKYLVDRHPEYQPLYARVVKLYRQITTQALENEQRASGFQR